MTADPAGYLLRAPWYVMERDQLCWDDPAAARPEIQMYDRPDFVKRVIADPRDSLRFSPDDRWSHLVPLDPPVTAPAGRRGLGGYQRVPLGPLKLYQPSHDRFYAVFAELFADEPGLPRPGAPDGVTVGFVVRRQRTLLPGDLPDADRAELRRLAGAAARQALANDGLPDIPDAAAAEGLLAAGDVGSELAAEYAELLRRIGAQQVLEVWTRGADQRGSWEQIADADVDPLAEGEQEHIMWRVPPATAGCVAAQSRSLWFGVVPTASTETGPGGARKFDEESTYSIHCFVRRKPPPERAHCPPRVSLSRPSASYRLADFFDPQGTRNRRFPVRTPDLRALKAQVLADLTTAPPPQEAPAPDLRAAAGPAAGGPPRGRAAGRPPRGGLQLRQPPGSQLSFGFTVDPAGGRGTIKNGTLDKGKVIGAETVSTTYALELVTIVAMFVLQMFLPIVLMLFNLWWMLALRFRWPLKDLELADKQAIALLQTHFAGNGTIATLSGDQKASFDRLAGVPGAAEQFAAADPSIGSSSAAGRSLLDAMAPQQEPPAAGLTEPLPRPEDPVCPGE